MIRAALSGYVDYVAGRRVIGWAWDSRTPSQPVDVAISRPGEIIASTSADRFRPDLLAAGVGNGCHGFEIELPPEPIDGRSAVFCAMIAGSGFELNRSPFRCGIAPSPTTERLRTNTAALERLKAATAAFSGRSRSVDNRDNRRAALSARVAGVTHLEARPQWFMIETTSHCNLRCVMCPHGHDAMPYKSHLDTSRFSNAFDFLATADRMQLFGTGEPLLSQAFWDILGSMQATHTEVSINSNGTLLNADRIERLLQSPLSSISISLDAARPETYRLIRGADFRAVVGNVRDLIQARSRRLDRRLKVFINMTLMRANIDELPEFVDLAADIGVDGVELNQLLWHDAHCAWEILKGDWLFTYREQLLEHALELANERIRTALERSAGRNVPISFDSSQFDGHIPIVQGHRP